MKLHCPKCDCCVEDHGVSRFRIMTCTNCKYEFRGIHADVELFTNGLKKWLLPLVFQFRKSLSYEDGVTACPHCNAPVQLELLSDQPGYAGPEYCQYCCNELPE